MSDVKKHVIYIVPANDELAYLHSLEAVSGFYLDELITLAVGFYEVEYGCAAADLLYDELYEYCYTLTGDGLSDIELEADYVAAARHHEAAGMATYTFDRVMQIGTVLKPLINRVFNDGFFEHNTLAAAYILGGSLVLRYDEYESGVPPAEYWARRAY